MLVEKNVIAPVGIGLEFFLAAEDRPAAVVVKLKDPDEAFGNVVREVLQAEAAAVGGAEFEQTFDQQVAGRKPDGPPPVGVAALEFDLFLGWFVAHAAVAEGEWMLLMVLG